MSQNPLLLAYAGRSGGGDVVAKPEAVRMALEALSIPQLIRISRFAKSCLSRPQSDCAARDFEDAIGDAILLIMSGDRAWDSEMPFEQHFANVIREVIKAWRLETPSEECATEPTAAPDPIRRLAAQEAWDQIQKLFADDKRASGIVHLLAEGTPVGEIAAHLRIDEAECHRLIHDIRVRMQRELPDFYSWSMHLTYT